jgi:hypothetical protein
MKSTNLLASIISSLLLLLSVASAQTWTDISTSFINSIGGTPGTPGDHMTGCGGVIVNRLNGDIFVDVTLKGIYKSTDRGVSWAKVSGTIATGKGESGSAFQMDQHDPRRLGMFCLDGASGFTADGATWRQIGMISSSGRGWDFGSIDWSSADPKTMIGRTHEDNGVIGLSTDGGTSWSALSVTCVSNAWGSPQMVGVIDSVTLIYSTSTGPSGIQRSTDKGKSWSQVSTVTTSTFTPVMFEGVCYVGAGRSLMASTDKGATWHAVGVPAPQGTIGWGPIFGADKNAMVVATYSGNAGTDGVRTVYQTSDAGAHWTTISNDAPPGTSYYSCTSTWWGNFAWDPIHNLLYNTAVSNPTWKKQLASTNAIAQPVRSVPAMHATQITSRYMLDGKLVPLTGRAHGMQSILFSRVK